MGTAKGVSAVIADKTDSTAATATIAQVSTLTIGGTYAAGDVITVNLNQTTFQYTVTADDTTSAALATNLAAALDTKFDDGFEVSATAGFKVQFTLDTAGSSLAANKFTVTSIESDGQWDDLESSKITSQSESNKTIATLDASITKVNKSRAEIGSVINRLSYAIDNLTNVSANATASRSRIEDTDYAKVTTNLAKSQIIQQAATAMLAQANQQPQSVLSLLK
jgi:flagellin